MSNFCILIIPQKNIFIVLGGRFAFAVWWVIIDSANTIYEGHQLKRSNAGCKKIYIKDHRVHGLSNHVKCQSKLMEMAKSSSSSKMLGRKWSRHRQKPICNHKTNTSAWWGHTTSSQHHFHWNYFDTHVKNCIGF